MLVNTLSVDFGGETVDLQKVEESKGRSTYRGESTNGERRFALTVNHTTPPRGEGGESHHVRLDVEHFTSDGTYVRTSSAWVVIKTLDAPQNKSVSEDTQNALHGLMGSAADAFGAGSGIFLQKILNGEP